MSRVGAMIYLLILTVALGLAVVQLNTLQRRQVHAALELHGQIDTLHKQLWNQKAQLSATLENPQVITGALSQADPDNVLVAWQDAPGEN